MTVEIDRAGPVWTITNNRPEARNACDPETSEALYAAFTGLSETASAKAAALYGANGAFCAGWDLRYASNLTNRDASGIVIQIALLRNKPKPSVMSGTARIKPGMLYL